VGSPARLAGEIEAMREDVLCLGEGAAAAHSVLEASGAEVGTPTLYPGAVALVELAVPRFLREETQRPEELSPLYLRDVDATISWHGRGALHGGRPGRPPGSAPGVEATQWR
jgi:tRNA A37 threonylcarbamoyladenosine modification protein TsaB